VGRRRGTEGEAWEEGAVPPAGEAAGRRRPRAHPAGCLVAGLQGGHGGGSGWSAAVLLCACGMRLHPLRAPAQALPSLPSAPEREAAQRASVVNPATRQLPARPAVLLVRLLCKAACTSLQLHPLLAAASCISPCCTMADPAAQGGQPGRAAAQQSSSLGGVRQQRHSRPAAAWNTYTSPLGTVQPGSALSSQV
jgi:hypothetical protein